MAKKRGGRREGSGRPRLTDRQPRIEVFSLAVTIDEKTVLNSVKTNPKGRTELIRAAERIAKRMGT